MTTPDPRIYLNAGLLALLLAATPTLGQQSPSAGGVMKSEPGRVAAAEAVTASAVVLAIDKATREITLKNAKGERFVIEAGAEVRNFDQIRVGDEVEATYMRALSMQVRKSTGIRERTEAADTIRAKPGDRPAGGAGRMVAVVADVIDVNRRDRTITLRGPRGNVVVLDVQNPDHFKVVKRGDQVEAVFVEALGIAVVPVHPQQKR